MVISCGVQSREVLRRGCNFKQSSQGQSPEKVTFKEVLKARKGSHTAIWEKKISKGPNRAGAKGPEAEWCSASLRNPRAGG